MEKISISGLMKKDHKRIEMLLSKFEINIGKDQKSARKSFNEFRWEIEKHFFIEEKAILTFYDPDENGDYSQLADILKEHEVLLKLLNKIKQILKSKDDSLIKEFKMLLLKHRTFEDDEIYPMLDKELTEQQKSIIVERIREILR